MTLDGVGVHSGQLASPVGIRCEDVYGTRDASNTIFDVVIDDGFIASDQQRISIGGLRDSRATRGWEKIFEYYPGRLSGRLANAAILAFATGLSGVAGGPTTYTHTIKPIRQTVGESDIFMKSYTVEGRYKKPDGTTDKTVTALGATCRDFAMNFDLDSGLVTYVLNFMAKGLGSTATVAAEETDTEFTKANTKVLIESNATSYSSGDQVYGLNSMGWRLNHNFGDPKRGAEFNSTTMDRQMAPGTLIEALTGNLTRKYIDTDLSEITQPFSTQIEHVRTASTDEIKVQLNNCVFSSPVQRGQWTKQKDIEDLAIDFKFAELVIVGKNDVVTYSGAE